MNPTLHERSSRDLDRIVAWSRALFADEGARAPEPRRHRIELFERLQRGARAFELAEEPNADAVAFALVDPAAARIEQFRVIPEARRRGIGAALVNALLTEVFPDRGEVTIAVLADNGVAMAFWAQIASREPRLVIDVRNRPMAGPGA